MKNNKNKKVVVIGLDGATFDLIIPWVKAGKLPVLKRLMESGSWGKLNSTIPPLSPPAWASFMTGKNPGKHRIYDFTEMKPNSYDYRLINASDINGSPFWEIAGLYNKRVCIINVPMTYPPKPVNGILISGMDSPGINSGISYPSNAIEEIKRKYGEYIIEAGVWGYVRQKRYGKALSKSLKSIELRTRIGKYLMKNDEYDLFVIVFPETDRIQHFFWKFMDPLHPMYDSAEAQNYGDAILKTYQACENAIEEFLQELYDDTIVIIMSDHGGGGLTNRTFCLNKWLESHGFLTFKNRQTDSRSPSSKRRQNIFDVVIEWVDFQAKKILPRAVKERLLRLIPSLHEKLETRLRFSNLDWQRTKIYADELRSNLRINLRGREPLGIVAPGEEYENLQTSLVNSLTDLVDPETGIKVVDKVLRREEVYKGDMLDKAPDLLVILNKAYTTTRWEEMEVDYYFGKLSEIEKKRRANAEHTQYGIFIINGKDIESGKHIENADIVDIAPTILYLLGTPIPDDMDGRVLTESINPEFVNSAPIKSFRFQTDKNSKTDYGTSYSEKDSEKIKEKLSGLGYLE